MSRPLVNAGARDMSAKAQWWALIDLRKEDPLTPHSQRFKVVPWVKGDKRVIYRDYTDDKPDWKCTINYLLKIWSPRRIKHPR